MAEESNTLELLVEKTPYIPQNFYLSIFKTYPSNYPRGFYNIAIRKLNNTPYGEFADYSKHLDVSQSSEESESSYYEGSGGTFEFNFDSEDSINYSPVDESENVNEIESPPETGNED